MRWNRFVSMLGAAALAAGAWAQGGDPCLTDQIQLNSGFHHTGGGGGAVYPIGAQDAFYQILYDPDPGTFEPRPAGVILKHPAWANPDTNSQWLGAYPQSYASLNGFYIFQVCFCLQEGFQNVVLTLGAKADDAVSVYLNETLNDVVTSTATPILAAGDGYTSPTITTIAFSDQARFRVGRNCIMFRVENLGAVAMGLDSLVSINAPGGFVFDPSCCSNGSILSGQKWNDLNGDGVWDAGEPVLANWPITVNPGGSTTTDSNGYYYFNGLSPGPHTVSEGGQSGWVQTFPVNGVHNVNLGQNEIIDHLDFGNVYRPCGEIVDESIICVPDDGGWSGCYDYTFSFHNTSGVTVSYVLITDPNVVPHIVPVNPPVPDGGTSGPITIRICPPDDGTIGCYPLHIALADRFLEECCTLDTCIELPDCHCVRFNQVVIEPTPVASTYSVSFSITNLTPDTVEHMFLVPEPFGAFTITPDYIDLPTLLPGQSSAPVKVVVGPLAPGEVYCIRVSIHTQDLSECCSQLLCFTAPGPDGSWTGCLADMNSDGVLDFFDVQLFLSLFAAHDPRADCTGDGTFDFFDVLGFLNAFSEGCPNS